MPMVVTFMSCGRFGENDGGREEAVEEWSTDGGEVETGEEMVVEEPNQCVSV